MTDIIKRTTKATEVIMIVKRLWVTPYIVLLAFATTPLKQKEEEFKLSLKAIISEKLYKERGITVKYACFGL